MQRDGILIVKPIILIKNQSGCLTFDRVELHGLANYNIEDEGGYDQESHRELDTLEAGVPLDRLTLKPSQLLVVHAKESDAVPAQWAQVHHSFPHLMVLCLETLLFLQEVLDNQV